MATINPPVRMLPLTVADRFPPATPETWGAVDGQLPAVVNRTGNNAIVEPDGDVRLCPPTVGRIEHYMGNLDDPGLTAVSTGARRWAVLAALDAMAHGEMCPRDCRHHQVNVRLAAAIAERS